MDLPKLISQARGLGHALGSRPRLRRVVARLDSATLARLDALVPLFPDASRAGLIRVFVSLGVALAEEHVKATPTEGGAP
jgi:hypothetical protein